MRSLTATITVSFDTRVYTFRIYHFAKLPRRRYRSTKRLRLTMIERKTALTIISKIKASLCEYSMSLNCEAQTWKYKTLSTQHWNVVNLHSRKKLGEQNLSDSSIRKLPNSLSLKIPYWLPLGESIPKTSSQYHETPSQFPEYYCIMQRKITPRL